ncbi:hypothetical protein PQX77_005196 [Marasmius sp. AFHP31]|nr:hypothetical protein PQX77_005196 [Marasmius sp. AFHP31]
MSSQSPRMDSPVPSSMQSFTFPVPISSSSTPSTPNSRRSASPDKDRHHRNNSQDIQQLKSNPEQLRPNPHPYAIKTTSTALLSRSNSASSKHTKHHYIPSTPPSRHRTTSSASNIEIPRPLPIPPPSPSDSGGEGNPHTGPPPMHQPRRLKRSETTATTGTPPAPSPIAAPLTLEELPPNPKQWTPSQLSIYLATALRISGPGELPAPVASDIARFVRERKITGRVFLRLSEEELEAYGMNKLWRTALLSSSRTLRQNVLKGRIWGIPDDDPNTNDSPSPSPSPQTQPSNEDETTPNNRKSVFIQRQRPVYSSGAESNSSIEDLQLPLLPTSISDGTGSARFKSISKGSTRASKGGGGRTGRFLASSGFFDAPDTGSGGGLPSESSPGNFGVGVGAKSPGRYKNGRVKGMAKGFERIASVDESSSSASEPPSPSLEDDENVLSSSPTHSRMMSGENKMRIRKDMEVLKMRGRVKMERERRGSLSSSSDAEGGGSPTKMGMGGDLPGCESPTKMFEEEEEEEEDYGATAVRVNHTGPAQHSTSMPMWDFDSPGVTMTMKKHDTGSSISSTSSTSSSSRPLPMPPGPPPASLPHPNFSTKSQSQSPVPTISTLSANAKSPIPTPPPSALEGTDEMTVEQLLALQGAGDSVRRRSKKSGGGGGGRGRIGVHAWENGDGEGGEGVGFVTAKRVPFTAAMSPSLVSPLPPSPPVAVSRSPVKVASPLPQELALAQSKRVITPISSSVLLPHRKITPIPAQVIPPMRVTSELPPTSSTSSLGGIVHPKPVTVVEREVTNSVGADTVGRMEEIVRAQERERRDREQERREKEEVVVVRPLPTPPNERMGMGIGSGVVAPLTALSTPHLPTVAKKAVVVVVTAEERHTHVNTEEQQELEDEEELQALIADVLKTKSQVDVMKRRLGEVEKSVEELKREVDEAEAEFKFDTVRPTTQTPPTPEPEPETKEVASSSSTTAAEKAKQFLFSAIGFSSSSSSSSNYTDPKSISDLPPYLALVGLGVCMVVVRVLLKRKGGGGR